MTRRALILAAGLLLVLAAAAVVARRLIAERFPAAPEDWWRPATSPPVLDPETLARAARKRTALAEELAERRERVRPIPERLRGGAALIQAGHAAPVRTFAWYGEDLATGGDDATARLWRLDGERPRLLAAVGFPAPVEILAADPRHERLWAWLADGRLVSRTGDLFDGESQRWVFHVRRALDLALADGGLRSVLLVERRAAAPDDPAYAVHHHHAANLHPLKEVPLRSAGRPRAAALAPDGAQVALAVDGPDGPAFELRRADDGALLEIRAEPPAWWPPGTPGADRLPQSLPGPDGATVARALPDGAFVVRSPRGERRVPAARPLDAVAWDTTTRALRAWTSGDGPPGHVATLDLAALRVERRAAAERPSVVDPETGRTVVERDGVPVVIGGGAERPVAAAGGRGPCRALRGDVLALDDGRELSLWSLDGAPLGRWPLAGWPGEGPATLLGDGRTAMCSGADGFVVFRAGEAEPLLHFRAGAYAGAPADLSADGAIVIVGRDDGVVEYWDVASGTVVRSFGALGVAAGLPTALRLAPDGSAVYVGSSRGNVSAWDAATGNALWAGFRHEGPVRAIVAVPETDWIVSSDLRTFVVGHRQEGQVLVTVAFAPDGEGWAVTTPDGYHVSGGASGDALVGLRLPEWERRPRGVPYVVVPAADPDFAELGGALDAVRVTLLGGGG